MSLSTKSRNIQAICDTVSKWLINASNYSNKNKWKSCMFAIVCGYLAYLLYKKVRNEMNPNKKYIPKGPKGLPFIGNFLQLFRNPYFLKEIGQNYGPITQCNIFGDKFVFINNSKLVKKLFVKELLNRRDYSTTYRMELSVWSVVGKGKHTLPVIGINDEEWKRRRKNIQTGMLKLLTTANVSRIVHESIQTTVHPHLQEICASHQRLWYPRKLCQYFAFNTVFHSMFGQAIDINSDVYQQLTSDLDYLFRYAFQSDLYLYWPFLSKLFPNAMRVRNRRNGMINKLIEERIQQRKQSSVYNHKSDVFIDYLLSKNNERIEDIADVYFLFAAGMDTTTSTLEFGVVLLAKHPEIQQRVRRTLMDVMRMKEPEMLFNDGKFIEFDLSLLNNVSEFRALVYEILRISSVLPMGVAHASNSKDIWVDTIDDNGEARKYVLTSDAEIFCNIAYIHRWSENESWLRNGDSICLENWLKSDVDIDGSSNSVRFVMNESFVSFGVGRRDCVGRSLAVKEMSCMLAYLLLNFKFEIPDGNLAIKIGRSANITRMVDPPIAVQITPLANVK